MDRRRGRAGRFRPFPPRGRYARSRGRRARFAWVGLAAAMMGLAGAVWSGLLVRSVLLDVVSLWPGLVLAAGILVIRRRMTRRRRGIFREETGIIVPLVLLLWPVIGLGLHVAGWHVLPSAAANLAGPPVAGEVATAVLDIETGGRVALVGGGERLYEVRPMSGGGVTAPARSSEVRRGDEVGVILREASDPGWFGSDGWNVTISGSPEWSLAVTAGRLEADLTGVRVASLRVDADGWVRLAAPTGDIPIFVAGEMVLVVPPEVSMEVIGTARVGPGWEVTAAGMRFAGTGTTRFRVEAEPGSDLVVERSQG